MLLKKHTREHARLPVFFWGGCVEFRSHGLGFDVVEKAHPRAREVDLFWGVEFGVNGFGGQGLWFGFWGLGFGV